MTPFEFDILLHYYSRANDHEVVHKQPPIWRETCEMFLSEDLLELLPKDETDRLATYRIMERGKVFVEAVLAMPLPVTKWVMPSRHDERDGTA